MTRKAARNTRFSLETAACYVITSGKRGPCKLGVTYDLRERLGTLQCGNWLALSVHGAMWFANQRLAMAVERVALQSLTDSGKHLRGEWFNVTPGDALAALEHATSILNVAYVWHDERVQNESAAIQALDIFDTIRSRR